MSKYRVTKSGSQEELEPESYFVIRDTDVFGAQALYGYAHLIQAALELDALPGRAFFSDIERIRLQQQADGLAALAGDWLTRSKKIPD